MDEMEQVCIRLEVYFGFYRPKQPILGVCSTNTVISHCRRYNSAFEDSNTIINIFTDTHDAQWMRQSKFASDLKCNLFFMSLNSQFLAFVAKIL